MTLVAGPTFQRGQATYSVNQQASGKDVNGTKQMPRSLAPTTLPRDTAKVTKGLKDTSKPWSQGGQLCLRPRSLHPGCLLGIALRFKL